MPALSTTRDTAMKDGRMASYPIAAGVKIFKGAVVILRSGYLRSNDQTVTALTAGDLYVGIAEESYDNTAGANGAAIVRVAREGIHLLPVSDALTAASVGSIVYSNAVSGDSTTTTTKNAGQQNIIVGRIQSIENGRAFVQIDNYVDYVSTNA